MADKLKKQEGDLLALELAVEDALYRIRRDYERCNGNLYLSFSGGKDSTVLAHLIMMANLPTKIPFLFSDTGIELEATVKFVKEFPYENIQFLKPRKPFAQIIKQYGKPSLSKLKSEALSTYQKDTDHPFKTARAFQLVNGSRLKKWQLVAGRNSYKIANKHMHFIHPDTEFKVANKCCQYLKKYPFEDFEKKHGSLGAFSGIRTAEGGARSMAYNSCVKIKRKRGKEFVLSMPIIDWTDEVMDLFIEQYQIQLSDAYTVYGLTRTGCMVCPYSQNLKQELKVLYDYEPNRYKAAMHWMKDVYMYQNVKCEFDPGYMAEYAKRQPLIEERRLSMIQKFRNPMKQRVLSLLSGYQQKQVKVDEFNSKYDILLMKQGEDGVYRSEFELMSAQLKSTRNVMDYLKQLVQNVLNGLNQEESQEWEEEMKTLPAFYRSILSSQGESEVPKVVSVAIQQTPVGMKYLYQGKEIGLAEYRAMKKAFIR